MHLILVCVLSTFLVIKRERTGGGRIETAHVEETHQRSHTVSTIQVVPTERVQPDPFIDGAENINPDPKFADRVIVGFEVFFFFAWLDWSLNSVWLVEWRTSHKPVSIWVELSALTWNWSYARLY